MANLTTLTDLILMECQLYGEFTSIVPDLSFLNLLDNFLSGAIPSSLFRMPSLVKLILRGNKLTGPLHFENISSTELTYLDLGENMLTGPIPKSISKLRNLETLYLDSFKSSYFVKFDTFAELKKLNVLKLSGNTLSIKSSITKFSFINLEYLLLSSCNVTEFPEFLKNLSGLKGLDLSKNKIAGEIPKWLFDLDMSTLRSLDLSHNFLTGFEGQPSILPWENMGWLYLSSNMLQGSILKLICGLPSLHIIDLSYNNLSGPIPQCFKNLSTALQVLNLGHNNLHGDIPSINASQLHLLDLSYNQFQGHIPRSLANCLHLRLLNLANNHINDTFPFWLKSPIGSCLAIK